LSYLSGIEQSSYLDSVTKSHATREKIYHMFSQAYVSVMRKHGDKITHIREHPIMIGIRKRQHLFDLVKPFFTATSDTIIKEFVELILHNPPHRVETLLLHSPLSLSDIRKPTPDVYVFTQRQILNKEHEDYFQYHSRYQRFVKSYNRYKMKPPKIHTQRDPDILVSYYTKYPNQMNLLFDDFKIYQHIGGDVPVTFYSVLAYAMDYPDIHAAEISGLISSLILGSDSDAILDAYNQSGIDMHYDSVDSLVSDIQRDDYQLTRMDYKLLSTALVISYQRKLGFAVYTNRYNYPDPNPMKFTFDIHISDNCLTTDISQIPIVCLYEDVRNKLGETPTLKHLVFEGETVNHTLGELCEQKSFKTRFSQHYPKIPLL